MRNASAAALLAVPRRGQGRTARNTCGPLTQSPRRPAAAALAEPEPLEALAQRAVEAAREAGAHYADARLTRAVEHRYEFTGQATALVRDAEMVGVGVRTLVNGYWGFAASPVRTPDEVVRLARDAVAQAKENAKGSARAVELESIPVVTGRWVTPVAIDPFSISIEEKSDTLASWMAAAEQQGVSVNPTLSYVHFARQQGVLATSDGSCVTQTRYESGGVIDVVVPGVNDSPHVQVPGITVCGKGWELFLHAKIPAQFASLREELRDIRSTPARPATVGRYTLVCDGATMAHLVERTFGLATQLDRALGYEANASGTSYLNDPLGMLGTLQVAAPLVTVTANRSVPAELATVKWDDEGVEPQETTLIKDGILHDFQTTREQAAWLAPYYRKVGKPVRSHGYAAAEDALSITLQHMPNLALEPGTTPAGVADLVANVKDGILVTHTDSPFQMQTDQQARNGFFAGTMRQIQNGRLGAMLEGGAVLFNTIDLWKHVITLGGVETQGVYAATALDNTANTLQKESRLGKGQPPQLTSHTVRGVAAMITDQALINLARKA